MRWNYLRNCLVLCLLLISVTAGCGGDGQNETSGGRETAVSPTDGDVLQLPVLSLVDLPGGKLRVVATTSIIGDVVAQVGGDVIELTTLMEPGQDPHSYEPGARALTAVANAHVIFVNGWDLEESLIRNLANIGEAVPIVPVSANITPLDLAAHDDEHEAEADHAGVDPHVWFSVANVEQWVTNIVQTLGTLDPDNSAGYESRAAAYQAELAELENYIQATLAAIPADHRYLVTNHGAFNYFAQAYDFAVVGAVIPGFSTLAEPSASDLSELIASMKTYQVCTIFTETTLSAQLAQVVTDELDFCDNVQVLPLYTGALGPVGSGADSYIGLMRTNVDTVVAGLQP